MNILTAITRRIAELERRQANLLRIGTVAEVDTVAARVRVTIGALRTAWLPWLTHHAGANVRTWSAPAVGEQVLVLSPSGELTAGVVLPALYCTNNIAPGAVEHIHTVTYPDGATISYDSITHLLDATLPAGTAKLTCTNLDATVAASTALQTGTLDAVVQTAANITAQTVTVNAADAATVISPAITLTASAVTITGAVTVAGTIACTGDVTAGAVSLMGHVHGAKPPEKDEDKSTPPKT